MRPEIVTHRADRGQDRSSRPATAKPHPRLVSRHEMEHTGTVKWFRDDRGYGFVDLNGEDVFLHSSIAEAYKVPARNLIPGAPVRFNLRESRAGNRPEVTAIALD